MARSLTYPGLGWAGAGLCGMSVGQVGSPWNISYWDCRKETCCTLKIKLMDFEGYIVML